MPPGRGWGHLRTLGLPPAEKIERLKGADNEYNLDYAVTATQKAIQKAFDMTAENIHKQARAISSDLARVQIESIEAANS